MKHNIGIPNNKNEILGADFSLIREKIKTSTISTAYSFYLEIT